MLSSEQIDRITNNRMTLDDMYDMIDEDETQDILLELLNKQYSVNELINEILQKNYDRGKEYEAFCIKQESERKVRIVNNNA